MLGPLSPARRYARAASLLALLALLPLVLVTVGWQPLLELDRRIAVELHRVALAHPGWTSVNRVLTDWVWDPWTMRLLLAGAVLALLRLGRPLLALWTAATSALCTLLQQGLKGALDRERPRWEAPVDSAGYAAMPSGHAMTTAVTCVLLLWLLRGTRPSESVWRAALAVAVVSIVGVAFTRVALGVHWPSDTVVGGLLGTAVGLGAMALWNARGALVRWRSARTPRRSG